MGFCSCGMGGGCPWRLVVVLDTLVSSWGGMVFPGGGVHGIGAREGSFRCGGEP
jgi:hypothetical protein